MSGAGIAARVSAGPSTPCSIAIIIAGINPTIRAIIVMNIVAIVLMTNALLDESLYEGLNAVIPIPMNIPPNIIEKTY